MGVVVDNSRRDGANHGAPAVDWQHIKTTHSHPVQRKTRKNGVLYLYGARVGHSADRWLDGSGLSSDGGGGRTERDDTNVCICRVEAAAAITNCVLVVPAAGH